MSPELLLPPQPQALVLPPQMRETVCCSDERGYVDIGCRMETALLQFHHLGLAVRRPQKAFAFLASLGYREGKQVFDPLQSVNLAMRHHAVMPDVEVIWPGEAPSPIDNLTQGGKSLVYHICFATENAERALADLAAAGHQVIEVAAPKPAILFGGLPVSFHTILGFGMIEIIHGLPE